MSSYKCIRCNRIYAAPGICSQCGGGLNPVAPKLKAICAPSYSVLPVSMANDLRLRSSDFPLKFVAERVNLGFGIEEISYVSNPTATSSRLAILPPGAGNPEASLLHQFSMPGANTEVMFIVKRDGELVFGTRPTNMRRPHPTLAGEADPEILAGGTITMQDGLIYAVRNDSGHHQPGFPALESMLGAFSDLPPSLYHANFQGFFAYGAPPVFPAFSTATDRNQRRNEHSLLRAKAQQRDEEIQRRLASDQAGLNNPRVHANFVLQAIDRHDRIFTEADKLLRELVAFATRYYPGQAAQASQRAGLSRQKIRDTLRCRVRDMDVDAEVLREVQAILRLFHGIPVQ